MSKPSWRSLHQDCPIASHGKSWPMEIVHQDDSLRMQPDIRLPTHQTSMPQRYVNTATSKPATSGTSLRMGRLLGVHETCPSLVTIGFGATQLDDSFITAGANQINPPLQQPGTVAFLDFASLPQKPWWFMWANQASIWGWKLQHKKQPIKMLI